MKWERITPGRGEGKDGECFEANTALATQIACVALAKKEHVGNVVAVVNGKPVFEGQVDEYVARFRSIGDMDESDAWASWLSTRACTELEVRRGTLRYLVNFILMGQAAVDRGVEVSEAEVDAQVKSARCAVGGQISLVSALAKQGIGMGQYRDGIRANLIRAKLIDDVASAVERPYDIEVLIFLKDKKVVDEKTDLSDIPEEGLDSACDLLFLEKKNEVFDRWFAAYRDSADIVLPGAGGIRL